MAYTHQMGVVHGDLKESRLSACWRLAPATAGPGSCAAAANNAAAAARQPRAARTLSLTAAAAGPPCPQACNVLLSSDPADPYGCRAQVADFGLSRALSQGASHLSTRTYGTVTHMAPELLSSGHLRQASDVYSFGIMRGRPAGARQLLAQRSAKVGVQWHRAHPACSPRSPAPPPLPPLPSAPCSVRDPHWRAPLRRHDARRGGPAGGPDAGPAGSAAGPAPPQQRFTMALLGLAPLHAAWRAGPAALPPPPHSQHCLRARPPGRRRSCTASSWSVLGP